jgi:hypothetical protein
MDGMLTVAAGFICVADSVHLTVSTVTAPIMKPTMPKMPALIMGDLLFKRAAEGMKALVRAQVRQTSGPRGEQDEFDFIV